MIDDFNTIFYSIRCLLAIILSIIIFTILIRKKKIVLTIILPIVIWFFTYIILTYMPVENLFLGFDTPEEAFRYSSNMNIVMVDEYDDYALIVSEKKDSHGVLFYILNKKYGKWKINPYAPKRDYAWSPSDVKVLCLEKMHIPNSNDCFILCDSTYFMGGEVKNVSDNKNSEFKYIDIPIEGVIDFYYGVVEDIDSDYECYVDGETITFK